MSKVFKGNFKKSFEKVYDAIRTGKIDAAEMSFPNLIDDIILTMKERGLIDSLVQALPDKRRDNSHIPCGEIGFSKAAKELGVNIDTLYGWNKRAKDARLDLGPGTQTPDTAMGLTEEVEKLRQQNREQAKETARLKEENEFLVHSQGKNCVLL